MISGWVLGEISSPKSSRVLAQLPREWGVTIIGGASECGDVALGDTVIGHGEVELGGRRGLAAHCQSLSVSRCCISCTLSA